MRSHISQIQELTLPPIKKQKFNSLSLSYSQVGIDLKPLCDAYIYKSDSPKLIIIIMFGAHWRILFNYTSPDVRAAEALSLIYYIPL